MFKWLFKPTLNELLESYLNAHKLAINTIMLTNQAWKQMVVLVGNVRVDRFTYNLAEQVQSCWQKQKSNTTARIYRKSVSPVFSWSQQKGYIKRNPFNGLRVPRESKKQVRVYEPEQFKNLLRICQGDMRWLGILLVAKTTGMRKSAIQNLTRSDISFENEVISVQAKSETDHTWFWQAKDRDERKLPLVPFVANILTELIYALPTSQPYIFLSAARYYHLLEMRRFEMMTEFMRLYPISNFDRKFRTLRKRAGVERTFHELRSSCLTDLAGVLNIAELQGIAGHSDAQTTMRYIGMGNDVVNKARLRVNKSLTELLTPSQAR